MGRTATTYKGFHLHASAELAERKYVLQICLTRRNASETTEKILTPPSPPAGVADEEAALRTAIAYAKAAIDNDILDADSSKVC